MIALSQQSHTQLQILCALLYVPSLRINVTEALQSVGFVGNKINDLKIRLLSLLRFVEFGEAEASHEVDLEDLRILIDHNFEYLHGLSI